jgi:hypothetical protein
MAEEAEQLQTLLNTFKVEEKGSTNTERHSIQIEQNKTGHGQGAVEKLPGNTASEKPQELLLDMEDKAQPPFR